MLSSIVSNSTPFAAMTRRIVTGAVLIAVGYVAALVAAPSSEPRFDLGIGHAAAAKHGSTGAVNAATTAAAAAESPRGFDYFPDHYTNQARDAAEQSPTF